MIVLRSKEFSFFNILKEKFQKIGDLFRGLFKSKSKSDHDIIVDKKDLTKIKQFSFFSKLFKVEDDEKVEKKIDHFINYNMEYKCLRILSGTLRSDYYSRVERILGDNISNITTYLPTLFAVVDPELLKRFTKENYQRTGKNYSGILLMYGGYLNIVYDFDKEKYFVVDQSRKEQGELLPGKMKEALIRLFDPEKDFHLKKVVEIFKKKGFSGEAMDFFDKYFKFHREYIDAVFSGVNNINNVAKKH